MAVISSAVLKFTDLSVSACIYRVIEKDGRDLKPL